MILAVVFSLFFITQSLGFEGLEFLNSDEMKKYTHIFVMDDFLARNHFVKSFLGGMFITICMTGLDQEMMQKNISVKTLKDMGVENPVERTNQFGKLKGVKPKKDITGKRVLKQRLAEKETIEEKQKREMVKMVDPFGNIVESLYAANTFAPVEIPTKIPSFLANNLAVLNASSSVTLIMSS